MEVETKLSVKWSSQVIFRMHLYTVEQRSAAHQKQGWVTVLAECKCMCGLGECSSLYTVHSVWPTSNMSKRSDIAKKCVWAPSHSDVDITTVTAKSPNTFICLGFHEDDVQFHEIRSLSNLKNLKNFLSRDFRSCLEDFDCCIPVPSCVCNGCGFHFDERAPDPLKIGSLMGLGPSFRQSFLNTEQSRHTLSRCGCISTPLEQKTRHCAHTPPRLCTGSLLTTSLKNPE